MGDDAGEEVSGALIGPAKAGTEQGEGNKGGGVGMDGTKKDGSGDERDSALDPGFAQSIQDAAEKGFLGDGREDNGEDPDDRLLPSGCRGQELDRFLGFGLVSVGLKQVDHAAEDRVTGENSGQSKADAPGNGGRVPGKTKGGVPAELMGAEGSVGENDDGELEGGESAQQIPERAVGGIGDATGLETELDEEEDPDEEHKDPGHQWNDRFLSP